MFIRVWFQKLYDQRAAVEGALNSYIEIETIEENNILTIFIDIDTNKLKIEWDFFYHEGEFRFLNNITVSAEDESKLCRYNYAYLNRSGFTLATLCQGEVLRLNFDECQSDLYSTVCSLHTIFITYILHVNVLF